MSITVDHRLIGSPLRSPWRIERSSVIAAESIRGSVELSGSSGASGVLGGNSRSRTHRGRLTGSRSMGRDEGARGWITCDPRGTWPELASRGTSGEAAGRLVEEKVGVTAGIVTVRVSSQSLLREPHSSLTLLTSLFFCGTPHILSVEDLLLTVFSLITSEQILLDCHARQRPSLDIHLRTNEPHSRTAKY